MLESMLRNRYPEAERLKQIKGVGTLIALTYMADAGRSLSFPQEPGCSLLRGPSTGKAQLGTERAANAYQ
jgi:transposase